MLEKKANIFKNRPPNIWNDPESLEEHHFLRYSADPFNAYNDGRVKTLYSFIQRFGEALRTHQADKWKFLIDKTIEVFDALNKEQPQNFD